MDVLGPSLWDVWSSLGQSMTPNGTAFAWKALLWFLFWIKSIGSGLLDLYLPIFWQMKLNLYAFDRTHNF
ncbi:hypothetical protein HanPI659440_Chr03g0134961 [Helianthus annuus]|nr:hypothetical protein HanHA300_Chr15g0556111 [Helianthus annuus]KAJ0802983.1 hypothetical protein HanPI659440_Chr03g0134961 [Helianthus annuus]